MLGGLSLIMENGAKKYPKINGLTGNESNPDTQGKSVKVPAKRKISKPTGSGSRPPLPGVDLQIFGGAPPGPGRIANMQGFVKDYFHQTNDVNRSHNIMSYFTPDKLPVLTTLATQFAVFNGWFSSIPGPTICNRAVAHYGTSFGQVGMDLFYLLDPIPVSTNACFRPVVRPRFTTMTNKVRQWRSVNLLKNQPQIFGGYNQFVTDCANNTLPEYSLIEPCYNDHPGPGGGEILASDQHPDHNVQEGEKFIARIYTAIRANPEIWESTVLLIVYDEHGGIYDHVVPPACTPDGYCAKAADTGTGENFNFDRLGVRVPAVLVSPYIPKGTVVPGTEDAANGRIFEHASIPATVTEFFLRGDMKRTVREKSAKTFLDLLSGEKRPDADIPFFKVRGN